MYTHYFNLKQSPFSIAPDPRYLFMSERHREALAHLLYGIGSGGGFVLLTGEIGAGKTTVCRCFMDQIPENCKLGYIFNPKLTVEELLLTICDEFGIGLPQQGAASVKRYVDAINAYLLASHAQARNNVLIIDEAQNLSAEVLEQLRLLTNLETSERKLLQIILIGQPELRTMLARPELEQLAQRVIARYHLGSLSEAETSAYIEHRLAVAGAAAIAPFPRRLMGLVHRLTKGVPRRINLLCDRALLGAYVENQPQVSRTILRRAAAEVFAGAEQAGQGATAGARWPLVAAGVAGGVVLSVVLWHSTDGQRGKAAVPAAVSGPALAAPQGPAAAPAGAASNTAGLAVAASAGAPAAASPGALATAVQSVPLPDTVSASGAAAPLAVHSPGAASATGAAAPLPATSQAVAGAAASSSPSSPADLAASAASRAQTGVTDKAAALRQLAGLWGLALTGSDPCAAAARLNLRCLQTRGGIDELRQLDRPAVLTLRDNHVIPAYVLLTALDASGATLVTPGGKTERVSVAALARRLDGDFTTYWRAPANWRDQVAAGDHGPDVDWLAQRLAQLYELATPAADQPLDAALRKRLRDFQAAQQLKADGVAGPKTFIRLYQLGGVQEPRLLAQSVAGAGK
ncbi:peptidoglycan-binding protein [Duganella sp. Leaf126]|uniref:ExeA family protein n=1 Tax=Duganella sp. Leaf126 TaxID=1736266 RepID=UPI0006F2AFA8|nr:ExeA family protein [Duganella sp. Leaf126]KQQ45335.1 peptidoglycan-binding protein [Duganella sp. Leaf126]